MAAHLATSFQSWDTALTGGTNSAHSACLTFGMFKDMQGVTNIMLISLWKSRCEYPALKAMVQRLYDNPFDTDYENLNNQPSNLPSVDILLIEEKASGYSLGQELRQRGIMVTGFKPDKHGDKETRARRITDVIEQGLVYLNCESASTGVPDKFGRALLKETSTFPVGDSMDVVDALSQCLLYLKQNRWLEGG